MVVSKRSQSDNFNIIPITFTQMSKIKMARILTALVVIIIT